MEDQTQKALQVVQQALEVKFKAGVFGMNDSNSVNQAFGIIVQVLQSNTGVVSDDIPVKKKK